MTSIFQKFANDLPFYRNFEVKTCFGEQNQVDKSAKPKTKI